MNEKIRDVDKMAEEVLKDRELWEAINDKIMEKNLEHLKMAYARDEGMIQGKAEEKREIAKKMKNSGKSIEEIVELTELTKEEIETL